MNNAKSPAAPSRRRPSAQRRRDAAKGPPNKDGEIPKYAPLVFAAMALKKTGRGKLELVDQFRKYKNEQVHSFNKNIQMTAFDANKPKNRYLGKIATFPDFWSDVSFSLSDVLCGDAGRVKLHDGMEGDYM